jgi:hypothetical protein
MRKLPFFPSTTADKVQDIRAETCAMYNSLQPCDGQRCEDFHE